MIHSHGSGIPRIEARSKVTGAAEYSADFFHQNVAQAALVLSPVARGVVRSIDLGEASAVAGVLMVMTHETMHGKVKKLLHFLKGGTAATSLVPLDSPEIHHAGQSLADR